MTQSKSKESFLFKAQLITYLSISPEWLVFLSVCVRIEYGRANLKDQIVICHTPITSESKNIYGWR
ncbi:MAG: hypothetical protein ABH835_04805, partial [Patescibacteria group bacterium]